VLEQGQVLAAEDHDLVGQERLPQGLGGGLVDGEGQVHALDLGANQGAGWADVEAAGQGLPFCRGPVHPQVANMPPLPSTTLMSGLATWLADLR
jgi:hypothetical protein